MFKIHSIVALLLLSVSMAQAAEKTEDSYSDSSEKKVVFRPSNVSKTFKYRNRHSGIFFPPLKKQIVKKVPPKSNETVYDALVIDKFEDNTPLSNKISAINEKLPIRLNGETLGYRNNKLIDKENKPIESMLIGHSKLKKRRGDDEENIDPNLKRKKTSHVNRVDESMETRVDSVDISLFLENRNNADEAIISIPDNFKQLEEYLSNPKINLQDAKIESKELDHYNKENNRIKNKWSRIWGCNNRGTQEFTITFKDMRFNVNYQDLLGLVSDVEIRKLIEDAGEAICQTYIDESIPGMIASQGFKNALLICALKYKFNKKLEDKINTMIADITEFCDKDIPSKKIRPRTNTRQETILKIIEEMDPSNLPIEKTSNSISRKSKGRMDVSRVEEGKQQPPQQFLGYQQYGIQYPGYGQMPAPMYSQFFYAPHNNQ